ncbi:MAG: di-trans,poly-cis-decaprenylcistransferase [Rhodobacteraceae bacterium]|nr:di-trans,poly-cis-decaprenylcistransferase [Paracoccaceae bacterium]
MDGNGRWATARGLPRTAGHRRGVEAVRRTVKAAIAEGISYLTLYGFSSENWKRPASEVKDLMGLLRFYLRSEIADLHKQGVRIRFIGDRSKLSRDIVRLIDDAEARTAGNTTLTLIIALSYGSRDEILGAVREMAAGIARGEVDPQAICEEEFSRYLLTTDIPDPDLVIRTSGEQRLSNFLLWQSAYAEYEFTQTLWPDFSPAELETILNRFRMRDRRYGGTVRA